MTKFSLEIKASAQKELDALDDALFIRIDAKILGSFEDFAPNEWPLRGR